MKLKCPHCANFPHPRSGSPAISHFGHYYRSSDSRWIQRFRCEGCKKTFSTATFHPCYRQLKRHKNEKLRRLLCSGVSMRRAARLLCLTRRTVARKLIFLGLRARLGLAHLRTACVECVEFDDMETHEHTKCKPLSITLAVESKTRRILGFEVSQMPARGKLAELAYKKYGPRPDLRTPARRQLFAKLKAQLSPRVLFKSDSNPHYPRDLRAYFPDSVHEQHLGRRGSIVGQGELKKIRFDPLFSLNHTCAMLRANINRLFRKTWCTTKKIEALSAHLFLYADFHNSELI